MVYKNISGVWMACKISSLFEETALLLLNHCPAHPSAYVLKLKYEKIRAILLTKNITALIQPTDQEIIQASIGYYHGEV
jgi:hypothetical protein